MRYALSNGLTVLVVQDHSAPLVAVQLWVRAGSADELPGEEGAAHLLEHLCFKYTSSPEHTGRRWPLESLGAEVRAATSHDSTLYQVLASKRHLAEAIHVLGRATTSLEASLGELGGEVEVVREELRRGSLQPSRRLGREVFAQAFGAHPYGRPVIGSEAALLRLTSEAVVGFYRREYAAANCVLVVVGDVEPAAVVEAARKAFAWPRTVAQVASAERPRHVVGAGPRVRLLRAPVREALLTLAWPTIAGAGAELEVAVALDALAFILVRGKESRLRQALQDQGVLCRECDVETFLPRGPGLTMVRVALGLPQAVDAVRILLPQVLTTLIEEVTPRELARAKEQLEEELARRVETIQGRARLIGAAESTSRNGLEFEALYAIQLRELTPTRLREVAAASLSPSQVTLVGLLPESDAGPEGSASEALLEPHFEALLHSHAAVLPAHPLRSGPPSAAPRALPARTAAPAPTPAQHLVRMQLPSGALLLCKPERGARTVAIRVGWPGGVRAETPETSGLHHLASRLVFEATAAHAPARMAERLAAIGGRFSGYSGYSLFGLNAEVAAGELGNALDVMMDVLRGPVITQGNFERCRKQQEKELRAHGDNMDATAFRLFAETLWLKHPYRMGHLGSHESLGRLTPEALMGRWSDCLRAASATIAVVGAVDAQELRELTSARLTPGHLDGRPAFPDMMEAEPARSGPRYAFQRVAGRQAYVVLGFPGVRLADPRRPTLQVLSAIVGGRSGRLFDELREKRSLAYQTNALSMEGADTGYFALSWSCADDKAVESVTYARRVLARLREDALDAEELHRAQQQVIGAHAIRLQRHTTRAAEWISNECLGLSAAEPAAFHDEVEAVSASDVLAAARELLSPGSEVLAVLSSTDIRDAAAGAEPR